MRRSFLLVGSIVVIFGFEARLNGENLVVNGSFENPVLDGPPARVSQIPGGWYEYQPPSSDWYYSSDAGVSTAHGGFEISNPNDPANMYDTGTVPDGNQYCFVQRLGNYVSEQVTFPTSGTYALSYYAGGRLVENSSINDLGGNTNYGLYLNSTLLADGTTTSNSPWTEYGPIYFSAPAGTQTLEILVTGITPSGTNGTVTDQTAMFDAVSITPVPEPSTFVLLGAGALSLLAYAWRWRQRTAALYLFGAKEIRG